MTLEEYIQKALRCLPAQQRRAFCFLPLFYFLLFGCASNRSALPQLPPITSAAELLHITSARYDTLNSQDMQATVDLTIDGVRERRASARIWHKKPSDLKMVLGGLGVTVMSAHTQNDTLHVHLPRENHYLVGHPEDVLFTLTGVDLSYYAVDRAILGLPNLSPLDAPRVIRFEPGSDTTLLELRHPRYLRRLWFMAQTGLLREEKVYNPDGQLISWRRLSDYHSENGFALPRHIEIHQGQDIILINVKSRKINTGLTDKDFDLLIPKDAIRHDIGY
jgi:outer membrane biogenesis lipoprotein LolB